MLLLCYRQMTTRGFLQDMGILGRVNASEMHIEYDNLLIQGNFVGNGDRC